MAAVALSNPTEAVAAVQLGQMCSNSELTAAPSTGIRPTKEWVRRVLSPTQVRTFLNCSARWWFKYGLSQPEVKNSALALGSAVHQAVEVNFREKVTSKEDLDTLGVVALFRDAWHEQAEQAQFRDDEDAASVGKIGEQLVAKYMDEAAPWIQPAAVEMHVAGEIGGVPVRGIVDLLDEEGRVVDLKTAARKPTAISPDYAFQLATYRQITPGATGEARLDTLVKTKAPQLIQQSYTVGQQDVRATEVLYPLVQEGIWAGLYFRTGSRSRAAAATADIGNCASVNSSAPSAPFEPARPCPKVKRLGSDRLNRSEPLSFSGTLVAISISTRSSRHHFNRTKETIMTRKRAEALTGYEVRPISHGKTFLYGAFDGEHLVAQGEHRKESIALTLLVNHVYQIHCRVVLDAQGWKCSRCGRSHGLHMHHRQFRSQGGTHRPDNLEPVCAECHRRIHRSERSK